MTGDFVLHSVPSLLSANKSQAWRSQIVNISTTLMRFLKDNDLLVGVEPFDTDGKLKEDFVLRKSNVTNEGFALYKKAVQGWLKFVGRGGKVENISRLEKGLAELRGNDTAA
jgi:hypothetical protein